MDNGQFLTDGRTLREEIRQLSVVVSRNHKFAFETYSLLISIMNFAIDASRCRTSCWDGRIGEVVKYRMEDAMKRMNEYKNFDASLHLITYISVSRLHGVDVATAIKAVIWAEEVINELMGVVAARVDDKCTIKRTHIYTAINSDVYLYSILGRMFCGVRQ